jgi:hypothetical protein
LIRRLRWERPEVIWNLLNASEYIDFEARMQLTSTILLARQRGTVKKLFGDSQRKGGWIWEWRR